MQTIEIVDLQLIDLSEGDIIDVRCNHCHEERRMKPTTQVVGNLPTVILEQDLRREYLIEVPDLQDVFIVECLTCGTQYRAILRPSPVPDL